MTVWSNKGSKKCFFKTIEELDRHRNLMLGLPVPRTSGGHVPWGYKLDSETPGMYEPIDEQFVLLVEAKNLMKDCTYRDLAAWMSQESGRLLSFQGLQTIMQDRQPDDRAALPREEREKLGKKVTSTS